jgi:serine/threonine protein kinase
VLTLKKRLFFLDDPPPSPFPTPDTLTPFTLCNRALRGGDNNNNGEYVLCVFFIVTAASFLFSPCFIIIIVDAHHTAGTSMDGALDAISPNSGGATPRRIVKTLKQPLACVTQLVPLDGGENSRPTNVLARLPATSIPSEASVSEVRSELCSVAYEEPGDESTSSFFDHRRIRHGGKVNSSVSRSRASRTVNASRARPRRSFRSVSSREVEESILSYSDEPVFYQCDSDASSGSAATEGSSYSMSYTAISESVPSCSLTALADPSKSTSGGWAGRFRKNNITSASRKASGSFGSVFGAGVGDPHNGTSLNSHSQQGHGRDSSGLQFAAAARGTAGGHRKGGAAAAAAAASSTSPNQQYEEPFASIKSPLEFKNTISPSKELPVDKDIPSPHAPSAGDTTALPEGDNNNMNGGVANDGDVAAPAATTDQRPKVQNVKLLERVGRGTFGDVYRAEDCDTGNIIAVKEIVVPHDFTKDVEKQLAALESEIRVMRRLHHPHVVTYLGANREGNSLRIFMEFVGGGTVGSKLMREGALPEEKTRNYTAQLLEGLEYLHASHILHRDLKGDNLFLTEQDQLKLGDFGQSKELADTLITQSVQGTPSFMSPEMIACSGYSFEADVWSVGCCVIQMLTGKPPFSNLDNQMAVMFAIISSKIDEQIPQDVSEGAKDFIRMCTKTNIKDRWSATQLRQHPWLLGATKEAPTAATTSSTMTTTTTTTPAKTAAQRKGGGGGGGPRSAKETTEQASAANCKPPRSILLDTAALSKTGAADERKKSSGDTVYQYSFNGDTPDNEVGGNTSSNMSSTKAESPAAKHAGDKRDKSQPSCATRVSDGSGGAAGGVSGTSHISPTMPQQASPRGRRPQRVPGHHRSSVAATPRADSAAIMGETSVNDSQGRTSPLHGTAPRPHRPSQALGESSPRHRTVAETGGKKRASSNTNNNPRTVNTPVNAQGGRGGTSPSHPRSGSRPSGSAIRRGVSPGNQTSRATPNAPATKPRAPATSRPTSHPAKDDRRK